MKWLLLTCLALLLVLFLWPAPAHSQAPMLRAEWRDSRVLVVTWAVPEPVRLYLVGGDYHDEWIERAGITASGAIVLPAGGVDQAEAPQLRAFIELRGVNGVVLRMPVPKREWRVILPVVVK